MFSETKRAVTETFGGPVWLPNVKLTYQESIISYIIISRGAHKYIYVIMNRFIYVIGVVLLGFPPAFNFK